jgi:predicted component of type VI protein secretion system
MSQVIDELNTLINNRAEAIAERILEMNMVSKADIATIIKANFKGAMFDMLKIRRFEDQAEYDEIRYNINKYRGREKIEKMNRFKELKLKRTEINVLYDHLDKHRQFLDLVGWMKEHHPDSLQQFYKKYDADYPRMDR